MDKLEEDRQRRLGIDRQRELYQENKDRIKELYFGEYVAVHDGEVFDHDTDYWNLQTRIFAGVRNKTAPIPIILEHVTEEEQRYTSWGF